MSYREELHNSGAYVVSSKGYRSGLLASAGKFGIMTLMGQHDALVMAERRKFLKEQQDESETKSFSKTPPRRPPRRSKG